VPKPEVFLNTQRSSFRFRFRDQHDPTRRVRLRALAYSGLLSMKLFTRRAAGMLTVLKRTGFAYSVMGSGGARRGLISSRQQCVRRPAISELFRTTD
jgi:hypothetical protein